MEIKFKLLVTSPQTLNLLLSRFLARARAHLFSESRNSIRTPNFTRCGTCNENADHDNDEDDDDDDDTDDDDDVEKVDLWKKVNDGVLGG